MLAWLMNIFCLLWVPLFYFFWRSLPDNDAPGGVWAFLLGILGAGLLFFLESLLNPSLFGMSRWLGGFFLISLPVLLPLLVYFLLVFFGVVEGDLAFSGFAGFTLSWLIPGAVFNALRWSSLNYPITLVLVPLLWTAIALGVPFLITFLDPYRLFVTILVALGILAVPLAAASSYWAFFSQKTPLGSLFLALTLAPMLTSLVLSMLQAGPD